MHDCLRTCALRRWALCVEHEPCMGLLHIATSLRAIQRTPEETGAFGDTQHIMAAGVAALQAAIQDAKHPARHATWQAAHAVRRAAEECASGSAPTACIAQPALALCATQVLALQAELACILSAGQQDWVAGSSAAQHGLTCCALACRLLVHSLSSGAPSAEQALQTVQRTVTGVLQRILCSNQDADQPGLPDQAWASNMIASACGDLLDLGGHGSLASAMASAAAGVALHAWGVRLDAGECCQAPT
jgi:hypothetical protein